MVRRLIIIIPLTINNTTKQEIDPIYANLSRKGQKIDIKWVINSQPDRDHLKLPFIINHGILSPNCTVIGTPHQISNIAPL